MMDAEKTGKLLGRLSRVVFWFIGLCGLISIVLGITQDDITLVAGGLLMLCAAPSGAILNKINR